MLSEEGKFVKKSLEQFNQAKRRLRNLQNELEYWKNLGGMVKSPSLEPHLDGGQTEPYAEKRLQKIEQLTALINGAIDEALSLEDDFLAKIDKIDPLSQNLLMERYMTGKSMTKILREFNYSDRHIYRLYDSAFEKIAENYKDDIKCQY